MAPGHGEHLRSPPLVLIFVLLVIDSLGFSSPTFEDEDDDNGDDSKTAALKPRTNKGLTQRRRRQHRRPARETGERARKGKLARGWRRWIGIGLRTARGLAKTWQPGYGPPLAAPREAAMPEQLKDLDNLKPIDHAVVAKPRTPV